MLSALLLISCQVKPTTGELVFMPEGYTIEKTAEFIKSIVNNNLIQEINIKFPSFRERQKGGFKYQPVTTHSLSGDGSGFGVIVKMHDLDDWDKKDEFKQYLTQYLKSEVSKLK